MFTSDPSKPEFLDEHTLAVIRANPEGINWGYVVMNLKLTEDLIREFRYCLDLGLVSKYQRLSEEFIREFIRDLDLEMVLKHQTVSEELMEELRRLALTVQPMFKHILIEPPMVNLRINV